MTQRICFSICTLCIEYSQYHITFHEMFPSFRINRQQKGRRYWVFGLCPSSGFEITKNTTLCCLPSPEDGNRSSFRNIVFLVISNPDYGQSPKTQYLCVLYTIVRTLWYLTERKVWQFATFLVFLVFLGRKLISSLELKWTSRRHIFCCI
jgi:hypothetical protein